MRVGSLQSFPLQLLKGIEMSVDGSKRHLMFDAERRDPEIILGNRCALPLQLKTKVGIHGGRLRSDIQNLASVYQPLNLGEVVGHAPRIQRSVSQLANHRRRKQELFELSRKEGAGLTGEGGNRDTRIECDATIATHGDRRARIRVR